MTFMMSSFFWLICFTGGIFVNCQPATGDNETPLGFPDAVTDFTVKMLKEQSKLDGGNVIMSPSGIATLLAILQQGAKENTAKQLDEALRLNAEESKNGFGREIKALLEPKRNVTLSWGNRLYVRPGLELDDGFNETISNNFAAVLEELNFVEPSVQEVANGINEWVKDVTLGNIENLITPALLTPDTILLALNVIYFKGLWDVPFKKLLTKPDKFHLTAESSVEVPFMFQKERFIAGEDPETGIQWVDLPFKDEQFSMLFILPKEKHGLTTTMEKLDGNLLGKVMRDDQTRQVTLRLPKFKLTKKVLVAEALERLGVKDLFTSDANLAGIFPNFKNVAVSKMVHQAGVEIDEDGTTASAATVLGVEVLSFPKSSDHLDFVADHPFLFFILDRASKVPLFVGKVVDPSA